MRRSRLDDSVGRSYDARSECLSRNLLAACKDDRGNYPDAGHGLLAGNALTRADHVIASPGGNVFVVQGALDDPAHKRAFVHAAQGMDTPLAQSDAKRCCPQQESTRGRKVRISPSGFSALLVFCFTVFLALTYVRFDYVFGHFLGREPNGMYRSIERDSGMVLSGAFVFALCVPMAAYIGVVGLSLWTRLRPKK